MSTVLKVEYQGQSVLLPAGDLETELASTRTDTETIIMVQAFGQRITR